MVNISGFRFMWRWAALALSLFVVAGALLSSGLAMAGPLADPQASPLLDQGPGACGDCHQEEMAAWQASPHGRAWQSEGFHRAWEIKGNAKYCLACHTTGYDPTTGSFLAEGVTCEVCHGPLVEGHPETAVMKLPADSEACESCHRSTYEEWQASKHGQQGVQCFYCHLPHTQELRVRPGERLCGACHGQHMEQLSNATHGIRGLECTTCHMLGRQAVLGGVEGSGVPAHDLSVGVRTCAECHRSDVHTGREIVTLRARLNQLQNVAFRVPEEGGPSLVEQVDTLEKEVETTRTATVISLGAGLGIGGFLGLIVALALSSALQRRGRE